MKKIWKIKLINNVLNAHARFSKKAKNKQPLSADLEFERIVIFSTTALGDLLFNTPAIRAIKQRYPHAKIMLVSSEKNLDLVLGSKWFDQVVIWDNKIVRAPNLIRKIRLFKPELALLLHSGLGYDILCARLGGAKYLMRDNFRYDNTGFNHWIDAISKSRDGHIIQRKLDLIEILGCNIEDIEMEFPITIENKKINKKFNTIGFQMSASEKKRCWPVEHFARLAEKLFIADEKTQLVLTGTAQDKPIEAAFFAALPRNYHARVTSYIGKTRLPELIQLINSIDVLVTGDTGPLHIAVAAKTPTVSLYVSANPRHTGPYQDLHMHHTIHIEPERGDDPTYPLRKIDVEKIYDVLNTILK